MERSWHYFVDTIFIWKDVSLSCQGVKCKGLWTGHCSIVVLPVEKVKQIGKSMNYSPVHSSSVICVNLYSELDQTL